MAAADQVDDTSTCVVQTATGDWPDLVLSVVEQHHGGRRALHRRADARQGDQGEGPGQGRLPAGAAAAGEHGPIVEIGWLSEAKQLQTLRFTFAKGASKADGDGR